MILMIIPWYNYPSQTGVIPLNDSLPGAVYLIGHLPGDILVDFEG